MMGSTHALMGGVAGALVAPALGFGPLMTAASVVITAGAALVPDLDHPNSSATLAHGPVTRMFSEDLRALSANLYKVTHTRYDDLSAEHARDVRGTHRYLTHTGIFAVVLGIFIGITSQVQGETRSGTLISPVRWAFVALMISFAIRGLCQFKPNRKLDRWPVRTVIGLAGALVIPITGKELGILIMVGCLTHDLGDWMTKSGIPFLWPIKVRGMYWRRYRAPLTSSTGKGHLEPILRWVSVIAAPAVFVLFQR